MYKLNCHCNEVQIEIDLTDIFDSLVRCNCSICKRRGAIMALVDQNNIRIVKGEDKLSLYQFHTNTAKHYFCSVCGIYTHHHTRRNTSKCGINVACIDEINPEELKNIRSIDGKNHDMDK